MRVVVGLSLLLGGLLAVDAASFSWSKFKDAAAKEAERMKAVAQVAETEVEHAAAKAETRMKPALRKAERQTGAAVARGKDWVDRNAADGVVARAKRDAHRLEKRARDDVEKDKRLQRLEEEWRKRGSKLLAEQKDLAQQEKRVAMLETQLRAARSVAGGGSATIIAKEEELNAKEAALAKAHKRERAHQRAWRLAGQELRRSERDEAQAWSALDAAAQSAEQRGRLFAKGAALLGLHKGGASGGTAAAELESDRKKWAAARAKLGAAARQKRAVALADKATAAEAVLDRADAEVSTDELARGAEELARLRRAARGARDVVVQQRSGWRKDAKAIVAQAQRALDADVRAARGAGGRGGGGRRGSGAALVQKMNAMVLEWGLSSSKIDDAVRRLDATREAVSAIHRLLNGVGRRAARQSRLGSSKDSTSHGGKRDAKAEKLRQDELAHVRAAGDGWLAEEKDMRKLAKAWATERSKTQRDVDTRAKQAQQDEQKVEGAADSASASRAEADAQALEQDLEQARRAERGLELGGVVASMFALLGGAVLLAKLRVARRQLNAGIGGHDDADLRPTPYRDDAVGSVPAREVQVELARARTPDGAPPLLQHQQQQRDAGAQGGSGFDFICVRS